MLLLYGSVLCVAIRLFSIARTLPSVRVYRAGLSFPLPCHFRACFCVAHIMISLAQPQDAGSFLQRQAIFDEHQQVFGYELFGQAPYTRDRDAVLLFSALTCVGPESMAGEKLVFLNCTRDSLDSDHLELIHPDRVVLEVPLPPEDAQSPEGETYFATLSSLLARHFRLAFKHHVLQDCHAQWLPLASFIKMDLQQVQTQQVPELVKFARTRTTARLVVEKIESQQQYEEMKALGIKLFQGYLLCRPHTVRARVIGPAHSVVMQLLQLVRNGSTVLEIEELLKQDPVMSFNLLRIINSSGLGVTSCITSFRQAVMVLGYRKLFRWAVLMLTTSSKSSGVPPAVGYTAVVRARLMELLAGHLVPKMEPDTAFLIGLFSLLDVMLDVSMDMALASIAPPVEVTDALLRHSGPFFALLELTLACETRDHEALAHLCDTLGLSSRQVNQSHLQALVWADSLLTGI